jgi:hypothetical protein
MVLGGKVWNTLDRDDRKALLVATYPNRSQSIVKLESKRQWNDLLQSTQKDLLDVDWSMVLDRDVRPDD